MSQNSFKESTFYEFILNVLAVYDIAYIDYLKYCIMYVSHHVL